MLAIGSRALIHFFPHLAVSRKPVDTDFICTIDEYEAFVVENKSVVVAAYPMSAKAMVVKFNDGRIFEFEIAWEGSTAAAILDYARGCAFAPPEVLLMLKLSHRYLRNSPAFLKTMRDIQFLRSMDVRLNKAMKLILKDREKETYTYAHPNLKQAKMGFFDASVQYTYDHDSIHEVVAVGERPAYTHFQKDNEEVYTSKEKFNALPLDTRLNAGLEESYVLAIERSLVPFPGAKTPRQAFEMALMKVCSSITSGWFREFCWENYDAIVAKFDESFWDKFQQGLAEGKIRPHLAEAA